MTLIPINFPEKFTLNIPVAEKLIDTVERGIGRVFKSHFDRKDIDTEAYRIKTISAAEVEVKKLYSDLSTEQNLEKRTNSKVLFQAQKQQQNIEEIIYCASQILKDEKTVDPEPIDEDWINQYFDIIKNISNTTMQDLWARILAGEIKQTNSFSLRALQVLRNMNQKEAECFSRICKFTIQNAENGVAFVNELVMNCDKLDVSNHINHMDYLLLIELGLISSQSSTLNVNKKDSAEHFRLANGDIQKTIIFGRRFKATLTIKSNAHEFKYIRVISLTSIGNELLRLVDPKPEDDENIKRHIEDFETLFHTVGSKEWTSIQIEAI